MDYHFFMSDKGGTRLYMTFLRWKNLSFSLSLLLSACISVAWCSPALSESVPAVQSTKGVPAGSTGSADETAAPEPLQLVWQMQQDEKGAYRVLKGSQFKVRLDQDLSSDSVQEGKPVLASLVEELKAGPQIIAPAGQQVLGIVNAASQSRKTIKSYVPGKNFLDAQGRIGFNFNGIVDTSGSLIKIDAIPSEKSIVDQVKKTKAQLVANKNGEYKVKYAVGKYAALDLAIGTVGLATGPVGIVTSALVSGVAGSVNKNFAAGRPVEDDEQYTKKQGFIMGVGRGLPGGFLIQGVTTTGKELELHKGDVLTLSLREDLEVKSK